MVALTEMFVTGYQTQDLILKPAFVAHAERAVATLAARGSWTARPWGSAGRM